MLPTWRSWKLVRTERQQLCLTHKQQWLLYVPPNETFRHSMVFPRSVRLCRVWISEITPGISQYNIRNWDAVCLLRGTNCICKYSTGYSWFTIGFHLPESFHRLSIHIFFWMFLLQRQTGESCEPLKNQRLSAIRKHWQKNNIFF